MNPSITISDVARAAGVSPKTVSRVINGEPHVSRHKQELVERAIAALDYRPNVAARSLASSRTFLIGLISSNFSGSYFSELYRRTSQACRRRGFHLVVEEMSLGESDAIGSLERSLRQMRFDGIILSSPITDDPQVLDLLERLGIPYVRISPDTYPHRSPAVFADEAEGMTLLAKHLWQLGHRRIGLPSGLSTTQNAGRSRYFKQAYLEAGGHLEDLCFAPVDWRMTALDAGRKLASDLLSQTHRPTAIFAFNDEVAAGLMGYAHQHGLRVPEDLSVVGFDDSDIAQLVWPLLTTIRQPIEEMARAAVALLLDPQTDDAFREICCAVTFKTRDSTGPIVA